jgi:hypothetical protein
LLYIGKGIRTGQKRARRSAIARRRSERSRRFRRKLRADPGQASFASSLASKTRAEIPVLEPTGSGSELQHYIPRFFH